MGVGVLAVIVQKFGGTSVATPELREKVLSKVLACRGANHDLVVVVSAMGRKGDPYATDTLLSMVSQAGIAEKRDLDMIMACGEIMSAAIVASTLRRAGIKAMALTGWQAGIVTDNTFGNARIITVQTDYLKSLLNTGVVPVVAGFQGASDSGEITTLGRGGSDTTAAAIGVALGAACVEIYTDVEGIMTADPRIVPEARVLTALDYSEVFQMASQGSKVIHPRAVELAMQRNIPLVIKSTFSEAPGTVITNTVLYEQKRGKPVTAVAHITRVAQVVIHTPDDDGTLEYEIFHRLADAGVSVDLINVSPTEKKFIISEESVNLASTSLADLSVDVNIRSGCAKVSIIGAGMRGMPGVMAKVVAALRESQVRILQTSDSHLTISVLTDEQDLERATKALHQHFRLNVE